MQRLLRPPTRTVRSRVFDSTRWDGYQPRPDDIIIATPPKCGTTWTQRIVSMLVFGSAAPRPIFESSAWFDMRLHGPIEPALAAAEAQTHRRFLKTHLPFDAVPVYEGVKFIHVARDGRDAAMSFHNHLFNFTAGTLERLSEISRNDPKFGDDYPAVPESAAAFFAGWVTDGGAQGDEGASFFHVEKSYWAARADSNMLLVHYNDLIADRDGEMRRIADFLGITIPEAMWPEIVAAAGFESMKAQGETLLPSADKVWQGGAQRFLHKGSNGRWQDVVSADDLARYDAQVKRHFSPDLARWVAGGRLAAG
jgi:aryl sulfotransferase